MKVRSVSWERKLRLGRDHGYLHHNARQRLQPIQLTLQLVIQPFEPEARPCFACRACGGGMKVLAVVYAAMRADPVAAAAQRHRP